MNALTCGQRQPCMQPRPKRGHYTQLIFFCCLLPVVLGYCFWLPGGVALSGSVLARYQQSTISPKTSHQVLPVRYPLHAVMRDPFAVPKEFQPKTVDSDTSAATNAPSASQSVLSSALPDTSLRLVGIVSGGGQQVAIIKTGKGSCSYQLGEYIGLHQLILVGESSVTLLGPHGQQVLALEW